jgi:predicted lipid carrier protein YhbT
MATLLPRVPRVISLAALPLPLPPLEHLLALVARRMARARPEMVRRLGEHAGRRFLIDPVDLPFVLLLRPQEPSLNIHRRHLLPAHDARLAGPLAAFLAMMHGAADGDALFFSRDLTVEGDTAAILALRNAMDDAELDLTEALSALAGPFAGPLRQALGAAERATGLALHRMDRPEACR